MPISTKVTYSVKKDERHRQIICALCPPHLPQLWYEADGQDDSTNSAQHVLNYAGNHGCGGFRSYYGPGLNLEARVMVVAGSRSFRYFYTFLLTGLTGWNVIAKLANKCHFINLGRELQNVSRVAVGHHSRSYDGHLIPQSRYTNYTNLVTRNWLHDFIHTNNMSKIRTVTR